MTYSLNIWNHPTTGQIRLYVNGTNRSGVYLMLATNGRVVWSSKTNETPRKFQTGNHYVKIAKDREAANEVADAFGIPLGDGSGQADFDRACQIARDGIQLEG